MPLIAPLKLSGITKRPISVLPRTLWRISHWLLNLTFFGIASLLLFCQSWEGIFPLNLFTLIVLSLGLIVIFNATSDSGNVSTSVSSPPNALTGMSNISPSASKWSSSSERPNWSLFRTWLPHDVTQKSSGPSCTFWIPVNPTIPWYYQMVLPPSTSDPDKAMMLNPSFPVVEMQRQPSCLILDWLSSNTTDGD